MSPPNQNPEQVARDKIEAQLTESGWVVQDKKAINFNKGEGQAVPNGPVPAKAGRN